MIKFLEGWQNVAAITGIAGIAAALVVAVVCLVAVGVGNLIVKQFEGIEE